MINKYLSVIAIERTLDGGEVEVLPLKPGVNLLVGAPNTGKTKWLQMLDHLLGDQDSFDQVFLEDLVRKYESTAAILQVGDDEIRVERRWKTPGSKTKVYVDDVEMSAKDFQHYLMELLEIPLLHFPKGNPMSGQTWPELSFRMLLRHMHHQQRFWSGLVDQQPEGEQLACLMQFLGLAENVYNDSYGKLVQLKLDLEKLKARREQFGRTLLQLSKGAVSTSDEATSLTIEAVERAEQSLEEQQQALLARRAQAITDASSKAFALDNHKIVTRLTEARAALVRLRTDLALKRELNAGRISDIEQYRNDLVTELERLDRTLAAGSVLADLKITHCPACDRAVEPVIGDDESCHLCHRLLPDEPPEETQGVLRIEFEQTRLKAEVKEADQLLNSLHAEQKEIISEWDASTEQIATADTKLKPAREAVAGLVSEEVSSIDVAMGSLNEKQSQLSRVRGAVELSQQLSQEIAEKENDLAPLQSSVDQLAAKADFDLAEERLESGLGEYLRRISELKPESWRHSLPRVSLTRSSFSIKIGQKKWSAALGATDTLFLIMSYHYGLLTLSPYSDCHYPGFAIIDLPGDFLGDDIEDKENFIVQPFIELLRTEEFQGAQVIFTGASFKGLEGAHRIQLETPYVE
ncbi:hypothetical protein [Pseudoxanthomonas sp. PXM01]|uniref:hypothetical protein n=1 Tax=Pseudoxanthomonas sp. PXM01 TaxID=2769295 RepID=UPI001782B64F|nr:hypothetical protein [Pseudoxanthomonas sp. PXM01]MBD9469279.1 hypothetical protein [Pseudoxanthomonas sp. PXM01]